MLENGRTWLNIRCYKRSIEFENVTKKPATGDSSSKKKKKKALLLETSVIIMLIIIYTLFIALLSSKRMQTQENMERGGIILCSHRWMIHEREELNTK